MESRSPRPGPQSAPRGHTGDCCGGCRWTTVRETTPPSGPVTIPPVFVRIVAFAAAAVFILVSCGSQSSRRESIAKAAASCTDRLVRTMKPYPAPAAETRRYVAVMYCQPFARKGWVYGDGSLSIEAQLWAVHGYRETCATLLPNGSEQTIPCDKLPGGGEDQLIDCGILRFVRRSEVQPYVAKLQRRHPGIRCEQGTPFKELGVPSA